MVIHERTGLLVDEHDFLGMAEAMVRMIDQPLLAERLGRAGRQRTELKLLEQRDLDAVAGKKIRAGATGDSAADDDDVGQVSDR